MKGFGNCNSGFSYVASTPAISSINTQWNRNVETRCKWSTVRALKNLKKTTKKQQL